MFIYIKICYVLIYKGHIYKILIALKSNSNTVWLNFQTYAYIYIYFFSDVYNI